MDFHHPNTINSGVFPSSGIVDTWQQDSEQSTRLLNPIEWQAYSVLLFFAVLYFE